MTEPMDAATRRGRRLEYFGLGWNMMEAAVSIGAGVVAGSTALLGFGITPLIESLSGSVLLWRLHQGEKGNRREQKARKLVGVSLLILAVYVAFEAVESLIKREPPSPSYVGITHFLRQWVQPKPLIVRSEHRSQAFQPIKGLPHNYPTGPNDKGRSHCPEGGYSGRSKYRGSRRRSSSGISPSTMPM